MSELRELQEWVQAAITRPDGGVAAAEAEHVVRGTAGLAAGERLELYRRSYHMRMVDALRASYPALCHLLGRELFHDFALDYLRVRPSRSYTLRALGAGFPDHLEATRPDGQDAWTDVIVELARLERTFTDVYEGEGEEELALPAAESLSATPTPHATVTPAPSLRVVRCSHAVGPYLLAVRRGEHPPMPAHAVNCLAVHRRDYVVRFTTLSAAEHELLSRLVGGAPIGADPGHWRLLREWTAAGFFRSVNNRHEEHVTP